MENRNGVGAVWKGRNILKVLFITNIPSPYRVDFFNELGKLCDLTVLFERSSSSERDNSWKNYNTEHFHPVFMKGINHGVANAFCPSVLRHIKKGLYDRVIVTNFTSPTGMLAITWLRMKRIPYWLESDGGFPKSGVGFREKIKRHFIKGAAGYFSTAQIHDAYYRQYGAEADRIFRYPFTSLFEKDILEKPVTLEEKMALREKLGITEKRVLLSVGQFIHRKGFDILFDALTKLPKNVGCYIVGGEPTQAYLEQVQQLGLSSVHFVGFRSKQALEEYYKAADMFVLPTREDIWGLVINEAMAKGLPLVTTDRCVAGTELITEPVLGRVVPSEDPESLAVAIGEVLAETNMQSSVEILERIRKYSVEEMAKQHIEILTEF